MAVSKIYSAQTTHLTAQIIDIEVDLSKGLHAFSIVGLADKSIDESKEIKIYLFIHTLKSSKIDRQRLEKE